MRRLPRRLWHRVHLASYGTFWFATLHGVQAGRDTHNALFRLTTYGVIVVVVFLTVLRLVQIDRRPRERPPRRSTGESGNRRPRDQSAGCGAFAAPKTVPGQFSGSASMLSR